MQFIRVFSAHKLSYNADFVLSENATKAEV